MCRALCGHIAARATAVANRTGDAIEAVNDVPFPSTTLDEEPRREAINHDVSACVPQEEGRAAFGGLAHRNAVNDRDARGLARLAVTAPRCGVEGLHREEPAVHGGRRAGASRDRLHRLAADERFAE